MKVWHKILVAPGVAIVFLLALGTASYGVLMRQQTALSELFEQRFGSYQLAARSLNELGEVHSNVYRLFNLIASLSDDRIKQTTVALLAHIDKVTRDVAGFAAAGHLEADERKAVEAALAKVAKYRKDVELAIDLSAGDVNTGMAAMQTADLTFQDLSKQFQEVVALETRLAQEGYSGARTAFASVTVALLVMGLMAVLAAVIVALVMSRRIVRPLERAITVADRIASGDLTSQIPVEGSDETAQLSRSLRDMNESLKRIVSGVRGGTDLVATA